MRLERFLLPLAGLWLWLPSCGLSPQPVPPNQEPDAGDAGVPPFLDEGRVVLRFDPTMVPGTLKLAGDPGSTNPPEGTVRVTNLDSTQAPVDAPVQPDGSFEAIVDGSYDDEYRFQAIAADGQRSEPGDFRVEGLPETLVPSVRAFADCLTIDPSRSAAWVGPSDAVAVTNACGQRLDLLGPRWRTTGFTVDPATLFSLDDGQSVTLVVTTADTTPHEDVLFIEVAAPTSDRRPVTLHVD